MRNSAPVNSNTFPRCSTRLLLNTPLSPYSQPSGPHVSELGSSCVSRRPKPVTTTSRRSARPSPSVSRRKRMSGELATHTPPAPTAMPEGMFSPSANTVKRSARPSPSVSSRIFTRSRPGPACLRGYSRLSVIQTRPRSSKVMATGLTMSGSEATSSTRKPSGTRIRAMASCGESAGPGGLDCPCGMSAGSSAAARQQRPTRTANTTSEARK